MEPVTKQQPQTQQHCIMGKTRKRSKFFKLFSCLNSKTGSVDENMRDLDEKSSPLSSPFQEIDSSSPGKPIWPPGGGPVVSHVTAADGKQHDVGDGCQATPPAFSANGSKERVRHVYSSTGSIIVTWPSMTSHAASCSSLVASQSRDDVMTSYDHRPLQSECRVNVRL